MADDLVIFDRAQRDDRLVTLAHRIDDLALAGAAERLLVEDADVRNVYWLLWSDDGIQQTLPLALEL